MGRYKNGKDEEGKETGEGQEWGEHWWQRWDMKLQLQ